MQDFGQSGCPRAHASLPDVGKAPVALPYTHPSHPQRFLAFLRPRTNMREPQSPQQEQRYLRDVFRERGDLLGDGWASAPLPAPRAVPPPRPV